jgi:hypothetical protein
MNIEHVGELEKGSATREDLSHDLDMRRTRGPWVNAAAVVKPPGQHCIYPSSLVWLTNYSVFLHRRTEGGTLDAAQPPGVAGRTVPKSVSRGRPVSFAMCCSIAVLKSIKSEKPLCEFFRQLAAEEHRLRPFAFSSCLFSRVAKSKFRRECKTEAE